MKNFYFFSACLFGFLAAIYAAEVVKPDCYDKEKVFTLLETAENLLTKANASFPSCKDGEISTEEAECGLKTPSSYLAISKKMISVLRENFATCSDKPKSCSEILAKGRKKSGVYTIWTEEAFTTGKSLKVYCDMETDKGGWTVIQRRGNFPTKQDFYLDWESYKKGFGILTQEFWLGNENIRVLCQKGCEIRFDLEDKDGEKGYAFYQSFNLSSNNYRIHISGYSGNVGDGMRHYNNYDFSTKDKGDTYNVDFYKSAWWHWRGGGYYCNLNGIYEANKFKVETVGWYTWREYQNLAGAEIKVRPK